MISTHSFIFSFVSLHNDSDDFITSGKAYIDSKAYLTLYKRIVRNTTKI